MEPEKRDPLQMDDHQRQCQTEWRNLCETLENAQAEDLVRSCKDRCQFVKTFRNYGNGFDYLSTELRKSARLGQFRFFCERGLPRQIMTPIFVDSLLQDWKSAIEGKKTRAREIFRLRFREDVESCIKTCGDLDRLEMVKSVHEADAVLQMSAMAQPKPTFQDIDELRGEIMELQVRLDKFSASVQDELATLRRLLSEAATHRLSLGARPVDR